MKPPMLALIDRCEELSIALCVSFDPDPGVFSPWMIDLGIGVLGKRVTGMTAEDAAAAALAAADQEDTDAG